MSMDQGETTTTTQASAATPAVKPPLDVEAIERLREAVIVALKTVYDPEIPVNIYDLGLVYDVVVTPSGDVHVDMTLTAPGCPVAGEMPGMVRRAVEPIEGVGDVEVELVWDPPWDQSRMSDEAKLELGWL